MISTKRTHCDQDNLPDGENLLQPSLRFLFETLASRYIITNYSNCVRDNLATRNDFNNDLIDEALEEWHDIALCPDRANKAGETFLYAEFLEEIKQDLFGESAVIKINALSSDADWNDIIVDAISQFDEPIKIGLQLNWSWERVVQLYDHSLHIDTALKVGLPPDTDYESVIQKVN